MNFWFWMQSCARKRQDQLRSTYNTQCNLCKKTKQFLTERKGCQGEDCNGAVDFRYVVKRPTETGLVNKANAEGKHPLDWIYEVWLAYGGGTHNLGGSNRDMMTNSLWKSGNQIVLRSQDRKCRSEFPCEEDPDCQWSKRDDVAPLPLSSCLTDGQAAVATSFWP